MKKIALKNFLILQFIFFLYSISTLVAKTASNQEFLSASYIFLYAVVIIILAIYAIFWQQVLHYIPLTIAYPMKGVTIIWGFIWGILFFNEAIELSMIIGGVIISMGICLVAGENE